MAAQAARFASRWFRWLHDAVDAQSAMTGGDAVDPALATGNLHHAHPWRTRGFICQAGRLNPLPDPRPAAFQLTKRRFVRIVWPLI